MSDADLERVLQRNAFEWTNVQRDRIRLLAESYLDSSRRAGAAEVDLLLAQIRAVNPTTERSDPSSSWSVFATWVVRRAMRVGKRLRDGA